MAKNWKMSKERRYLRAILAGKNNPEKLAAMLGMKLDEFACWVSRPRVAAMESAVRRVREMGVQMLLSEQKMTAVYGLAEMASSRQADENLRRVCSELLRSVVVSPGLAEGVAEALSGQRDGEDAQSLLNRLTRLRGASGRGPLETGGQTR